MLRGNWRYLLAIGIAALLAAVTANLIYKEASALQALYEHQASQNAETYRQTASEHARGSCSLVASAERYKCIHTEHHEARDRQRQEYDLQAQLVTSAWTRAMGIAAIIGMFVGIIGVGLIYATFGATKEANMILKAEADRNTVEAHGARKHVIQTERAIIEIERVNVAFGAGGKTYTLTLNINNQGKSNAWELQLFTTERRSRRLPNSYSGHQRSSMTAYPSVPAETRPVTLRAPQHYPVWVSGYLAYTTSHDARFQSFFCFKLTGVPGYDAYGDETINPVVDARNEVGLPQDT